MTPHEAEVIWVSAHIFHQGPLDRLVTEVAGPLFVELAAAGLSTQGFFLRYWEGGPHLRFRVRLLPGADAAETRRLIRERACAYLRRYPSQDVLDREEYARLAEVLAAREGLTGHARELYPNDSVQFISYRPEHHRYGRGPSLEAVERHFAESSRIALELLHAGLTIPQRGAVWLTMLMATWLLAGSRGEDAFRPWPDARKEQAFDRERERLTGLARHARQLTLRPPDPEAQGVLAAWHGSVARLADALAASGFTATRTATVLDLCAHLLANRLGIRIQDEARLRYLASRALDEAEVTV
ncbi:hypothetical protein TBS_27110 [Thermobispora bispora]|uniref:Thiopeptide-type bacteriocin biosynthesis domain-containing protein n=1 Tax=Thermobispora bispora (strain ATCC 19993 / DSM 43833 / CBS 139.67 / JCM 10125 / KCTC 9307 / NBRC 14880 / R51) TaxID=469371 RepID=D6Y503_THEBD|nr:thiopeptide-type bacteriocin biosynthesis protein [Thermobispora bispora]ADG87278.1 hypothetical protein Tbis_0551 [Thermobispora bispora DSM 43833]MBO2475151.1 lantibiotic biosynthesis protein [Actinomycetales bacterium]MDI9580554.1 thiopeptide-type bacteriocin biosynthesis protein [Thermobispora sp.]